MLRYIFIIALFYILTSFALDKTLGSEEGAFARDINGINKALVLYMSTKNGDVLREFRHKNEVYSDINVLIPVEKNLLQKNKSQNSLDNSCQYPQ